MLKLAVRNMVRQKARAALTLAAVALGVASLVLSGGFVADILKQLADATIRSQLGHLQIYKQGQFASGGHQPLNFVIEDQESVARQLASMPQIATVGRRVSFSGLISNGRGEMPIVGEGVEAEPEAKIGSAFTMLEGHALTDNDSLGLVLGEGLAKSMKLRIDDTVTIVLSTREGATNSLDFRVVGIFRSLSKEYDARVVRILLPAAQELTAMSGITAFVVLLKRTDDTALVRAELERRLPPGLEVKTWQELADFYNNAAALYQREFGFLQGIIVVMVLLSVANSVNMTLHERIPEFGIMRALGRTGSYVFRLAVLETAALGVIGAGAGILIGAVVALIVSAVGIPMAPPPNSETGFNAGIQIVPAVLGAAFLIGLLATVCASLLPAGHCARVSLVEALRRAI